MWETYSVDASGTLEPIRFAWQDQPVTPPIVLENIMTISHSHVAIGGHTVMAAGQIAEGAVELFRLNAIDQSQLQKYLSRAVNIINGAVAEGVIEWNDGLVNNANLLEVPSGYEQRRLPGGNYWGQAAWQQLQLVQALIVLKDAGRLLDIVSSEGGIGYELLDNVVNNVLTNFRIPQNYTSQFGDEWRYHGLQVATYFPQEG
jgi:hypothetical protein